MKFIVITLQSKFCKKCCGREKILRQVLTKILVSNVYFSVSTKIFPNNNKWAVSRKNQHTAFATSTDPDQPAYPHYLIRIHAVAISFSTCKKIGKQTTWSWSDCADAQACLDPCWSQTLYVDFAVTRLKWFC
jgi:hypothetical protein